MTTSTLTAVSSTWWKTSVALLVSLAIFVVREKYANLSADLLFAVVL